MKESLKQSKNFTVNQAVYDERIRELERKLEEK